MSCHFDPPPRFLDLSRPFPRPSSFAPSHLATLSIGHSHRVRQGVTWSYMSATVFISSMNYRRIARARAWLNSREPAEEILIIGASLDAANEVARAVAQMRGAA